MTAPGSGTENGETGNGKTDGDVRNENIFVANVSMPRDALLVNYLRRESTARSAGHWSRAMTRRRAGQHVDFGGDTVH